MLFKMENKTEGTSRRYLLGTSALLIVLKFHLLFVVVAALPFGVFTRGLWPEIPGHLLLVVPLLTEVEVQIGYLNQFLFWKFVGTIPSNYKSMTSFLSPLLLLHSNHHEDVIGWSDRIYRSCRCI